MFVCVIKRLMLVLALLGLAGCAGGSIDVTHQELAPGVYAVAARGDEDADEAGTERYMFQRAARITLDAGYRYFSLDFSQTEVKTVDDELIPRSFARIRMHKQSGPKTYDAKRILEKKDAP
jgi:hypothetical protein